MPLIRVSDCRVSGATRNEDKPDPCKVKQQQGIRNYNEMSKIPRGRSILYFLLVVLAYGVHRIHKVQMKYEREDFMRRHGSVYQRGDAAQRLASFVKSNQRSLDRLGQKSTQLQSKEQVLTPRQNIFSNALFKVCMGMDREVAYRELLSDSRELKNNPEVARQLKCILWVCADCAIAHTNLLERAGGVKERHINLMFDEAGSWVFPSNPTEITTNALQAINLYKREKKAFLSVVANGTNTLSTTLGKNSDAGKMYLEILQRCSKEWPGIQFCDIWIDEASVLAEVGRTLSASKKWQMVDGVPVCEEVSLYKSLLKMANGSDIAWNKSIAIWNELPQSIVEGGLTREEHATRQAFECANQRDLKSIFGIRLGALCKVFKRSEYDLNGVVQIDKVYYEQKLLSNIREGYLEVKLPLKFHSITSVKLRVDKLTHRIYEIEGESDSSISANELSKILEQIEDKYTIAMMRDAVRKSSSRTAEAVASSVENDPLAPFLQDLATATRVNDSPKIWRYQTPKYGKVLEVKYTESKSHIGTSSCRVTIRLKDTRLSEIAKESEEQLEDILNKAAL